MSALVFLVFSVLQTHCFHSTSWWIAGCQVCLIQCSRRHSSVLCCSFGSVPFMASGRFVKKGFSSLGILEKVPFQKHSLHSKKSLMTRTCTFKQCLMNISNMKDWAHFQTPRRELKIWHGAGYFWWTMRCLEMWANAVSCVWYILLIETKTKVKMEKWSLKNLC